MRTAAVVIAVILALVATAALTAHLAGWEVSAEFADRRAPHLVWGATLAALLAAGILGSLRQKFSETVFSLLAWAGIFALVILGYSYKDEVKFLWARVRAEVFAGEAVATAPGEIEVRRSGDGHFYLEVTVNGAPTQFMIDTGASMVALSWDDARAAGFKPEQLDFYERVNTASGPAMSAPVVLDLLTVGPILRRNVRAAILPEGVEGSLLGMSFLDTLKSYEIAGDRMTLRN
ncbi:MAG: TIGR02281 family clan AA aspartic protease [Alphaproteobacteria bacterium]|nr:TIGR02281 family clan AA aspartic protease [Alphaproteobacteria bacterium]